MILNMISVSYIDKLMKQTEVFQNNKIFDNVKAKV